MPATPSPPFFDVAACLADEQVELFNAFGIAI
jgi:hypothetical protein